MSISAIVMLIVGLALLNLHRHPDLDALDAAAAEAQGSEL